MRLINYMKLPRRIHPDPIVDSVVEIRFDAHIDRNAVFGVLYFALRDQFPNVEALPVLQIPEMVREADPMFAHRPQYRISNSDYQIQIGSNVLTIGILTAYPGWEVFSGVILNIYNTLSRLEVIGTVRRLGIRYISFFEGNIFDNLNLQLCVPGYEKGGFPTTCRFELPNGDFINTLSLANHTTLQRGSTGVTMTGSIVDIDISLTGEISNFFEQMSGLLNQAHQLEKELFYSLLTEDFLARLNPEY